MAHGYISLLLAAEEGREEVQEFKILLGELEHSEPKLAWAADFLQKPFHTLSSPSLIYKPRLSSFSRVSRSYLTFKSTGSFYFHSSCKTKMLSDQQREGDSTGVISGPLCCSSCLRQTVWSDCRIIRPHAFNIVISLSHSLQTQHQRSMYILCVCPSSQTDPGWKKDLI